MKRTLSSLALAGAALLAAGSSQAAIVLSFTPSSSNILIGQSVTIDISISGLGSEILSAVDINFLFNLGPASNTAGNFQGLVDALGPGANAMFSPLNPAGGEVGILADAVLGDDALAAIQTDAFSLGTLTFTGLADGATTLTLGPDPDFQRNFVGRRAQSLDVQVGSACIAVGTGSCATVPEPASFGLAGLALLMAGFARRKVLA